MVNYNNIHNLFIDFYNKIYCILVFTIYLYFNTIKTIHIALLVVQSNDKSLVTITTNVNTMIIKQLQQLKN